MDLANGSDFVRGVAGDTDIVAALEGELDVTDFEDSGTALFGVLACGLEDLVDKVVGYLEDRLGVLAWERKRTWRGSDVAVE